MYGGPFAFQNMETLMDPAIEEAIRRAAQEDGIDPATALAYAERESGFNPYAKSSKTIRGLFQMNGDLRGKYGSGDSVDPYEQAKGWGRFYGDLKKGMARRLGRDVTDAEAYAGHHFGEGRASRMFGMAPDTPVDQVFTAYERSLNPHIDRAGTVGNLLTDTTGDIDRRRTKWGAGQPAALDFSQFEGSEASPQQAASLDFSQFGE